MTEEKTQIAAIDLGSNSFHMAIAQLEHGEIRIHERLGEKVQLGAGIKKDGRLDAPSIERALDCLRRFEQRLRAIDRDYIQVVGTNALRVAKNRKFLIEQAEELLDTSIEVISGREEARLIYLGVAHTLADDHGRRLVIDIGGGSTEFIIGQRFEPEQLESLHMGCVSFRDRFFPDGTITQENMNRAITHAERELQPIKKRYKQLGWAQCVGSSGSIKAIFQALGEDGTLAQRVSVKDMAKLRDQLIDLGAAQALADYGVKKERLSIFPAGFAILYAAFNALGIEEIEYTGGALREGLLYDMLGRIEHEDVRDRSISALQSRYSVDVEHSEYVCATALSLYEQVKDDWKINHKRWKGLLTWTAKVFEVGLTIAHSQYHKHGAYLLEHSDAPGFSTAVQSQLALIVRAHRRKFPIDLFDEFSKRDTKSLTYLVVLFRLAVLLTSDREHKDIPLDLKAEKSGLSLSFQKGFLDENPLTLANLDLERFYLKKIGFELCF